MLSDLFPFGTNSETGNNADFLIELSDQEIRSSQGLYIHRIMQHKKVGDILVYVWSGVGTRDLGI